MSQPLIITGMHHSATSVVAELFRRAGVFMGASLLPPDSRKPRGFFEDTDFLTLQREMVAAACSPSEASANEGWPDWGWTVQEKLRVELFARYEDRARHLAETRTQGHPLWGWKDPRTTLLLDFWLNILPNAKFIFSCREPWAVAASINKLGVEPFDQNPSYAPRIWSFYNRRLLDFHRAHPGRCLFLPASQLNKTPHKILERITSHFGFAFISHDRATCQDIVRAWSPGSNPADKQLARTFAGQYPEQAALWLEILDAADAQWNTAVEAAPAAPAPVHQPPPPPRLSIVIPCFNDGPLLLEAIESIDACPDRLHETVVVDDGSTDPATREILEGLARRGIAVVHQENAGVAAALNAGIRAALGEYVLPMGADNKLRPAYITRGVEILDAHPDVGVVYGDAEWFGAKTGPRPAQPFDFYTLHLRNYIDTTAVLRRRAWEDAGGFDPVLREGYEDRDLWLSIAGKGWKFHYIPEVLFDYRLRAGSLSTKLTEPETHRRIVRYIVAKHPSYAGVYADVIADMSAMMIQPHMAQADAAVPMDASTLKELAAELEAAKAEIGQARAQLEKIQETRSWRVTSPLRALHRVIQKP